MPEITEPVTGHFCWVELATTDTAGARRFYGSLLDWTFADMPGPMSYAMASHDGRRTAGLMELPEEARRQGVPPHWMSYIAVDDVQQTVDKAVSIGGTLVVPPMAIGPGTFAVIQDPTGAVFSVWKSQQRMGTFLVGEPGGLGWNELLTTDPEAARAFYGALFGWTARDQQMPDMVYTVLSLDGQQVGGLMSMPADAGPAPSHWSVYFVVSDVEASAKAAVAAGGKAITPLMHVPEVGRFGLFADPQGATFELITFEARSA